MRAAYDRNTIHYSSRLEMHANRLFVKNFRPDTKRCSRRVIMSANSKYERSCRPSLMSPCKKLIGNSRRR